MAEGTQGAGGGGRRIFACVVAVAAFVLAVLYAGSLQLAPFDDAFITLRYAARLVAGEGLTYQGSEVTEGFTSPLAWLLESACLALGLGPEKTLFVAGALPWLGLALLVAFHTRGVSWLTWIWCGVATASLIFQAGPLLWIWSGMDVGAFCFVAVVHYLCLRRGVSGALLGFVSFLVLLVRPEGGLLFLISLAAAPGTRTRIIQAAVFGCLVASLTAVRLALTGLPLPLTYYAKLGDAELMAVLRRGLMYVLHGVAANGPLLFLAALILLAQRRAPRALPCLYVAVMTFAVVLMGGDHFAGYRFLLPAMVMLQFAAITAFSTWIESQRGLLGWCGVAVWGLVAFAGLARGFRAPALYDPHVSTLRRAYLEASYAREWKRLGEALKRTTEPDTKIGAVAIGALGYASQRSMYDPHGLVNPTVAMQRKAVGTGLPGHEKFSVEHALAAEVDIWVLFNLRSTRPMTLEETISRAWGEFAQELGQSPEFLERYELFALPDGTSYWNLFRPRCE